MSPAQHNGTSHTNDTTHPNSNPRSLITVTLWCIALGTHIILIPKFIRELYQDSKKHRS